MLPTILQINEKINNATNANDKFNIVTQIQPDHSNLHSEHSGNTYMLTDKLPSVNSGVQGNATVAGSVKGTVDIKAVQLNANPSVRNPRSAGLNSAWPGH
jgi:hypothetical protein